MAAKRIFQFVSVLSACLLALSLVFTSAHATQACIYYVAKGTWISQDGTS